VIEYDGEQYVLGKEAAVFLKTSRPTFYQNVWPHLVGYQLPGRKRTYYKLIDLKPFARVSVVKQATGAHFFAKFHSDCEQNEGGTIHVPDNTTSY
jgi:hypothetical protein